MSANGEFPVDGGCDCDFVRYRMEGAPLFVHCCHCSWCQRESGGAFALNALIEADRVRLLAGSPILIDTPSESGQGQKIARCPKCSIALWSHYAGAGPLVSFIRVGTLDRPGACPPDIHIFTRSKQPWVTLPPQVPAVEEYYDRDRFWPDSSLIRREALLPRIEAYQHGRACSLVDASTHEAGTTCLRVYDDPPASILAAIDAGLESHNHAAAPLHQVRPLAVAASLGGDAHIVGGASGRTWGACCELMQLWVDARCRRQGVGTHLLDAFEKAASVRGCRVFYLTTLSYQAPDFYRVHGYRSIAEIAGYPQQTVKYLMLKTTEAA